MNPPVKELVREYENTTPTDIIRFLPNDLVIELEDMMDPCFLTDEVSLPLNPVKIASYVTSRYHGVELCEEVSEINGLSIPAMYEETYRETNTIKEFVHTHWKQHAYKFKIKHVDYSDKSIGNQLLITNIYNAIKDGLVFKVAQINKDKYDWITPENIRDIHENMKKHIHTPEQLTYEEAISSDIHFKQDIYVEMDEFIQRKCTNIRPVKLRFTGIVDAIDDAKQKLAQAERLEADLKEQLKDARQQSQKLILEAEQDMDRLYRDALAAATADANASREQARREIDSQRDQAMDRLNKDADKLGDLIVTRLLAAS